MIRQYQQQLVAVEGGSAKNRSTIYCDSTDNKPTSDLVNGSRLIEVDTGKTYLFDESNSTWTEVSAGGGGGGGALLIKQTELGGLDKTFDEIKEAIIAGKVIQLSGEDFEDDTTLGYTDTTLLNAYYSIESELITLYFPVTISYQNSNLIITSVSIEVTSDNVTYQPYQYNVSATPVS